MRLLILTITVMCAIPGSSASAQPAPQEVRTPVSTDTLRDIHATVSVFAMARPDQLVVRTGDWGATVAYTPVRTGQRVEAGTTLMILDSKAANRRKEDAELCLRILGRTRGSIIDEIREAHLPIVTRSRSYRGGFSASLGNKNPGIRFVVGSSSLTSLVEDPASAATRRREATEGLGINDVEELECRRLADDAERDLSGLEILADVNGWVKTLPAADGEYVAPSDVLLVFENPYNVEMLAAVDHGTYQRVQEGARCTVHWDSDQGGDSQCSVTRKMGVGREPDVYWLATQVFDPPQKGAFADMTGTLTVETTATMPAIARDAIITDRSKTGVYIVTPDSTAVYRTVQTGRVVGDYVEIVGAGAGVLQDARVVRGATAANLENGDLVDPVPWMPLTRQRSDVGTMHLIAKGVRDWTEEPSVVTKSVCDGDGKSYDVRNVQGQFHPPGLDACQPLRVSVPSTPLPIAAWPGVTTATAQADIVTGITLSAMVITRPLPREIGLLNDLRFLVIADDAESVDAAPLPVWPIPREVTRLSLDSLDLRAPLCVPGNDHGIRAWMKTIPGARAPTCLVLDPPMPRTNDRERRERRIPFEISGESGEVSHHFVAAHGYRVVDAGVQLKSRTTGATPHSIDITPAWVKVSFYAGPGRLECRVGKRWVVRSECPGYGTSRVQIQEITGHLLIVEEKLTPGGVLVVEPGWKVRRNYRKPNADGSSK